MDRISAIFRRTTAVTCTDAAVYTFTRTCPSLNQPCFCRFALRHIERERLLMLLGHARQRSLQAGGPLLVAKGVGMHTVGHNVSAHLSGLRHPELARPEQAPLVRDLDEDVGAVDVMHAACVLWERRRVAHRRVDPLDGRHEGVDLFALGGGAHEVGVLGGAPVLHVGAREQAVQYHGPDGAADEEVDYRKHALARLVRAEALADVGGADEGERDEPTI
mmetsp:Transcript_21525/g.46314  ORF Transcript_21525/g.46314 Transcript_21525/m.46314 type:complete len:219 (+) Transcript_21525:239-895(+)